MFVCHFSGRGEGEGRRGGQGLLDNGRAKVIHERIGRGTCTELEEVRGHGEVQGTMGL